MFGTRRFPPVALGCVFPSPSGADHAGGGGGAMFVASRLIYITRHRKRLVPLDLFSRETPKIDSRLAAPVPLDDPLEGRLQRKDGIPSQARSAP